MGRSTKQLYHAGLISDRALARKRHRDTRDGRRGAIGRGHINQGKGGGPGYGPADLGNISSRANRKMFPKESTPGQQSLPGNSMQAFDANWYSAGPGRARG